MDLRLPRSWHARDDGCSQNVSITSSTTWIPCSRRTRRSSIRRCDSGGTPSARRSLSRCHAFSETWQSRCWRTAADDQHRTFHLLLPQVRSEGYLATKVFESLECAAGANAQAIIARQFRELRVRTGGSKNIITGIPRGAIQSHKFRCALQVTKIVCHGFGGRIMGVPSQR